MLIALIDDGVNTAVCPEVVLQHDLAVDESGTVSKRDAHDAILTDHGTTCAKIIAKYAPEATFCSLRIFDSVEYDSPSRKPGLRTSCNKLAAALAWCCEAKVPIVHISAGTSLLSDRAKIQPIIAKMLRQRQVVIAAHSNGGECSAPASLGGVLGIAAGKAMCDNAYKIIYGKNGCHEIWASSKHTLSFPHGREAATQFSNSYAAPVVAAAVHNELSAYDACSLSVPQVVKLLAKGAVTPRWITPDFIEEAYLVNPGGGKILKRHLFFHCKDEFSSLENWRRNAAPRHDLAYLPAEAENITEAVAFLKENASVYEGLLFGGRLPHGLEPLGQTHIVWGEFEGFDCCLRDHTAQRDASCPTITICGDPIEALDLLCRLRDLFILDGYECACLSDAAYAYLYGLEYIPSSVDRAQAIEHFKQLYQPDVVLSGVGINNMRLARFSEKCVVSLNDDREIHGALASWYIPNNFGEKDVLALFYKGFKEFFE